MTITLTDIPAAVESYLADNVTVTLTEVVADSARELPTEIRPAGTDVGLRDEDDHQTRRPMHGLRSRTRPAETFTGWP